MPKERLRLVTKDQINQSVSPYTVDNTRNEQMDTMTASSHPPVDQDHVTGVKCGSEETNQRQTNLIVNYLPQSMSQEDIRLLFQSVGEIDTCKLIRDRLSGQSLGYGFVNYKKHVDAMRAISSFNGLRLQNKAIKVSFARPSCDLIKGANLYISGLSRHVTSSDLTQMLAPYGQIITSRVLCDPHTGQSKGVGFIRFNLKTEAEVAIKHLNGTTPPNSTEPITVKFANQPTNSSKIETPQPVTALSQQQLGAAVLVHPGQLFTAAVQQQQQQMTAKIRYLPLDSLLSLDRSGLTSSSPVNPSSTWCLFILNLPPDIDESVLWALFTPYGAVQSVKVVREGGTVGKCKGFGFVNMLNYEDCLNAIAALDGFQIDTAHVIRVSFKKSLPLGPNTGPSKIINAPQPKLHCTPQQCTSSACQQDKIIYAPAAGLSMPAFMPHNAHSLQELGGSFGLSEPNAWTNVVPTYININPDYYNGFIQPNQMISYAIL